jgi:predicted ATPase
MLMEKKNIERLTIKGFKSIRNLDRLLLRDINILIGPNGSGKSNFISYFQMMRELLSGRLRYWTEKQAGADRIVSFGVKETDAVESEIEFSFGAYKFRLEVTKKEDFLFAEERVSTNHDAAGNKVLFDYSPGPANRESSIKKIMTGEKGKPIAEPVYEAIAGWRVFHFHDTSDNALVKRSCALHDNEYLRPDASNLAAFLYMLSIKEPGIYRRICDIVRLAIPFFDDFVLKPDELANGDSRIHLYWRQKDSDYVLTAHQLSDGAVSFICLVTALLQPVPPSTIILDEPELGLHPYAVTLLASLLQSAATRMQVIVATQSAALVDEFSIDDLIIAERHGGETVFRRKEGRDFEKWIEEYSIGELWEKNILGGGLPE